LHVPRLFVLASPFHHFLCLPSSSFPCNLTILISLISQLHSSHCDADDDDDDDDDDDTFIHNYALLQLGISNTMLWVSWAATYMVVFAIDR
jgi:hypothetical protein